MDEEERELTYCERRAQEPMYRYFESATALIIGTPVLIILADFVSQRAGDIVAIACLLGFLTYNVVVGYKFRRQEEESQR
ncbi:hypothetical protein COV05_01320 [Candidatus Uhrbacteria bacterium CG10_big_fil_rev_8_21_14_0_10_48_16]|uniref:Uncharacterized protein n=1 Tax=Candidatus Uhrbacteria bacterium CG10_big_fil_rev_8_21_14_0_10_48_16 TaxID=1975038 RepID=A0A2M8LHX8_9BACT|nr:MAG: hypothetical protein COV05_01320 [Candidatus Uhrbacteria bacterium CG10_big_fil_rev_8_21_14_0_10_48_16]